MTIPDAFKIVCRRVFQDSFELFASIEALAEFALAPLDDRQTQTLKAFLDDLLSGRHDVEEIERIWWEGGADIYFPNSEHVMVFLRTMRSVLDRAASRP